VGADFRSDEHNSLMYKPGCPWRQDPSDCTGSVRPDASKNGLAYLYRTFDDAAEYVIKRYGAEGVGEEGLTEEEREARLLDRSFDTVNLNNTLRGLDVIQSDPNVCFVLEAFAGDLFQGWGQALQIFYSETDAFLAAAHFEFLLFYCIYIFGILCLFYYILFRRSLFDALTEADKARRWVYRVPFHILSKEQTKTVEGFFVGIGGNEEATEFVDIDDSVFQSAHSSSFDISGHPQSLRKQTKKRTSTSQDPEGQLATLKTKSGGSSVGSGRRRSSS